jgi:hypothetical protein
LILDHYGRACVCCGESEEVFLTIDHINNDGKAHRDRVGKDIYRDLIKNGFPPIVQVMCWNCNCAKAICGICPHQSKRDGGVDTSATATSRPLSS